MSDLNNTEQVANAMDDFNDDTEEDNEIGAQITMAVDHIINDENFDSGEPLSASVAISEQSSNDVSGEAFENEDLSRDQWQSSNARANIEPHLSDHTYERSRPLSDADYDRMESENASLRISTLDRQQQLVRPSWRSLGGSGPVRRSPRLRTRGALSELLGQAESNRRIHGYAPYQNHPFSYRRRSTNNNIDRVIDLTGSPVDRSNNSARNSPTGQDSASSGNDAQFSTWSGTTGSFNPTPHHVEFTPMVQFPHSWNNPPAAVPLRSGSSCSLNARSSSARFGRTSSASAANLYSGNTSRDAIQHGSASAANVLAVPSSGLQCVRNGLSMRAHNIPVVEQYHTLARLARELEVMRRAQNGGGAGGSESGGGNQQEAGGTNLAERMDEEEEAGNSSNATDGARASLRSLAAQGGADDDGVQRRITSTFGHASSHNVRSIGGAVVSTSQIANPTRLAPSSAAPGNVINSGRLSNINAQTSAVPSRPLNSAHANSIFDRMMDDSLLVRQADAPPASSNHHAVPSIMRHNALGFARSALTALASSVQTPSEQSPVPYNVARQAIANTPRLSTNPLNFLTHTSLDTMPRSLEDLSRELVQLLECPICFDYAVPPIAQCLQGHIACGSCRPKLTTCPSCRSVYQEARNLLMEKVASMVRFPCKNSGTGCEEQLYLFQKDLHEQSCGFRQFACLVFQCTWKGYKPEVLVHMRDAHSTRVVNGESAHLQVPINGEKSAWLMNAFEEIFHVSFFSANHSLFGCVQYIGPSQQAKRYSYKFAMMSEDGGIPRSYCYTRLAHSFDEHPEEGMLSYDLFNIGHRSLNHFRSGARVNIQVTLSRKSRDKLLPLAIEGPSAVATVESEPAADTSSV